MKLRSPETMRKLIGDWRGGKISGTKLAPRVRADFLHRPVPVWVRIAGRTVKFTVGSREEAFPPSTEHTRCWE
jgi:hypothetical protein